MVLMNRGRPGQVGARIRRPLGPPVTVQRAAIGQITRELNIA